MRTQFRTDLPDDLALFLSGKSAKKNPFKRLIRRAEKMRMKLLKPVLGENLEDVQRGMECQRSARRTAVLLNPVLGANLEDLHDLAHEHRELECQRSASGSRGLLALPPTIRQLRLAARTALR